MKTLDEVIKAYEICMSDESKTTNCKGCPYADEEGEPLCIGDDKEDAFHYLKEYQKTRQDLLDGMKRLEDKEMIYIKAIADLEDNPPLMEGKSVWIENDYSRFYKCETVKRLGTNKLLTGEIFETSGGFYRKEDQGRTWNAYRKERK